MKILQLVTERQFRGAQVFAAGLSEILAENGHEVLFVGIYPQRENILSAKGAENFDLGGKKIPYDVPLLFRLMKLIKKAKPDIIQANGSDTLKYIAVAKIFYPHLNVVYRNISMVSAFAAQGSFKKWINNLLFKKVDRVTSVGEESLNDLIKTYGFAREKTKVIHRWIPYYPYDAVESRKKVITEFNFAQTDFVLVNAAKFAPEKNQVFLVDVFEKLVPKYPHLKLLLVGEGKEMEKTKAKVIEKNLDKNIFFTGYRNNVQEIVAGCDLFVMGSLVEGVPGAIMEAAVQSVAAVAVSTGGVSEVVMNGKTGVLVEKHDVEEFAKAVVSMIENNSLRKSLGANARQFILAHYTREGALREFESLYNGLLKEKSERAR